MDRDYESAGCIQDWPLQAVCGQRLPGCNCAHFRATERASERPADSKATANNALYVLMGPRERRLPFGSSARSPHWAAGKASGGARFFIGPLTVDGLRPQRAPNGSGGGDNGAAVVVVAVAGGCLYLARPV